MVKWINSWAKGIIIAVIISTIIEMILPEGKIKKYVRTVIGTYIVFIVISPIISKITGKEISLKMFEYEGPKEYSVTTIDTNAYIESTYINKLKQEVTKDMQNYGYEVKYINIEIEKTELNYGSINKMEVILKKDKFINEVDKIEIKIHDNNSKNDGKNFDSLKTVLSSNYGVKLENIQIKQEET